MPLRFRVVDLPAVDNVSSQPFFEFKTDGMRIEFFAGFLTRHPVFAPSTSPSYSNSAFQILAYALESITGKPTRDMFSTDLVAKLQLDGTSYSKPADSTHGVIPTADAWELELGDFGP